MRKAASKHTEGASHERTPSITFERLQSQKGGLKVANIFLKTGLVLCRELDYRSPETTSQPKFFYENILFHWKPDFFGFTDWEYK